MTAGETGSERRGDGGTGPSPGPGAPPPPPPVSAAGASPGAGPGAPPPPPPVSAAGASPGAEPRPLPNTLTIGRRNLLATFGVPAGLLLALLAVIAQEPEPVPRRAGPAPTPPAPSAVTVAPPAASEVAAALERLQALEAQDQAGGDAVAIHREATAIEGATPAPEVTTRADALRRRAQARLEAEVDDVLRRGAAAEAAGHEWQAQTIYRDHLRRSGEGLSTARRVEEAFRRAGGRVQLRLAEDLPALDLLVHRGDLAGARALVATIAAYGGPAAEATALERAGPTLAAAGPDPTPAPPADPAQPPPPAAAPASPTPTPGGETPATAVSDDARRLGVLLGCACDAGPEGAVRLAWSFDDPAELDDLPLATQALSGALQPAHLAALEPDPAWRISGGVLVYTGWSRRQLVVDFAPDRPLRVELAAPRSRTALVAVGVLTGRQLIAGAGLLMDLPLDRLEARPPWLDALVARSRDRGPVDGLARERSFLELDELFAHGSRAAAGRVVVDVAPASPGKHAVTVEVDGARVGQAEVELDEGPLRVALIALGQVVALDALTVTGTPSADIRQVLPALADAAGADRAAARAALRDWLSMRRPVIRIR